LPPVPLNSGEEGVVAERLLSTPTWLDWLVPTIPVLGDETKSMAGKPGDGGGSIHSMFHSSHRLDEIEMSKVFGNIRSGIDGGEGRAF